MQLEATQIRKLVNRNIALDAIRGIAALFVCASHVRNTLLVDYAQIEQPAPINQAIYLFTSLGHQAVIVFFVLSGFFVGGSVLRDRNDFIWANYIIARLCRLWLVLLPALAFTLICDKFVGALFPSHLTANLLAEWNSTPAGPFDLTWSTLIGNIIFLQTVTVPIFGSNGPLWSLANEFWYYMLFPIILTIIGAIGKVSSSFRLSLVALIIILLSILPRQMLIYFSVWLAGALIPIFSRTSKGRPLFNVACIMLATAGLIAAITLSKSHALQQAANVYSDIPLTLFSALLIWSLGNPSTGFKFQSIHRLQVARRIFMRAVEGLADISYSLYLTHLPLLILLALVFNVETPMQPNIKGVGMFVFVLAACIVNGWIFWWMFERHTTRLKRYTQTTIYNLQLRLKAFR